MRRLILVSALALCCAAPVASAKPKLRAEPYGPECTLPPELMAAILKDSPDARLVRLDGKNAKDMMRGINTTGDPTSFVATTLVVRVFDDRVATILFSPCAGRAIVMSIPFFMKAIEASKGEAVPDGI